MLKQLECNIFLIFMGIGGLFATGSTFRNVIDSTQAFINRKDSAENLEE